MTDSRYEVWSVIGSREKRSLRYQARQACERIIPASMRATVRSSAPIAIQPLGNVPPADIAFVQVMVRMLLGVTVVVLPGMVVPSSDYDYGRRQVDADRLLELLFSRLPDNASRIIGVLDEDMFAAGRTFVFGYAHLRDGVSVYSLARLREEWYGRKTDETLLRSRVYRAVTHELGHTFGNPHCDDYCVMHAVSHVDSLDDLAPTYCSACMRRVRRGTLVSQSSAEGRFLRAGAFLRRHYPARAAEAYRDAATQSPFEPRYHNDLGVALLSLERRSEARTAFRHAADLAADFPHPYYNLGILCREEGGVEAAERHFADGLARDPDPLSAHRYLGKLYDELFADPERARKHYLAYIELGGGDSEIIVRSRVLDARSKERNAAVNG